MLIMANVLRAIILLRCQKRCFSLFVPSLFEGNAYRWTQFFARSVSKVAKVHDRVVKVDSLRNFLSQKKWLELLVYSFLHVFYELPPSFRLTDSGLESDISCFVRLLKAM